MERTYKVDILVCYKDKTWKPATVEVSMDDDGDYGHTEGDIWEDTKDQYILEHPEEKDILQGIAYNGHEEITEGTALEIAVALCPKCGCDMDRYATYVMCCNCEHKETIEDVFGKEA